MFIKVISLSRTVFSQIAKIRRKRRYFRRMGYFGAKCIRQGQVIPKTVYNRTNGSDLSNKPRTKAVCTHGSVTACTPAYCKHRTVSPITTAAPPSSICSTDEAPMECHNPSHYITVDWSNAQYINLWYWHAVHLTLISPSFALISLMPIYLFYLTYE